MAITFKSFIECVPFVINIRKPILLRSRHGVGKSAIVYQLAEKLDIPVVERRASQMTEGDLLGLPKLSNGRTEWLPPDWLKTACDEKVVLFIDELDRATPEVRQGFFELADSRKIAGHVLHPDTLVFAAINGGEHVAQYQVGEMDPAELDRWTVFVIEPSIEDWLNWGKEILHSIVWNFINDNHQHLEHNKDFEPNKVYPSRRSWHRLSDCIKNNKLCDEKHNESNRQIVFNVANAFIGLEGAVAFDDYCKNYQYLLSADDVLDKGKIEETKKLNITEQLALIERIEATDCFKRELTAKEIKNLVYYFISLPSELSMKLWDSVINTNKNETDNTKKKNNSLITVKNATALHSYEDESKIKLFKSHMIKILNSSEGNQQKSTTEEKK